MATRLKRKAASGPPRKRPPKTETTAAESSVGPAPEAVSPPVPQPVCRPVGLPCPRCGTPSTPVLYTRHRRSTVRRVRRCLGCKFRFCTTESVV